MTNTMSIVANTYAQFIIENSNVDVTRNTNWVDEWMDGNLVLTDNVLRASGVKCTLESDCIAHYTMNGTEVCKINLDDLFGKTAMFEAEAKENVKNFCDGMAAFTGKDFNQIAMDAFNEAEWGYAYGGTQSTTFGGYGIIKSGSRFTFYELTQSGLMGKEITTVTL